MAVAAAVGLSLAASAACGSVDGPGAGPTTPTSRRSDGKADTARGAGLFAQHCASCHGVELEGTTTGPPLRSDVYKPDNHPDPIMRSAIRKGQVQHHWRFGAMPAHPDFTDADIDDLVGYVREQQQARGFLPYPGDPRTMRRGGIEESTPSTVPRHVHGSPIPQ